MARRQAVSHTAIALIAPLMCCVHTAIALIAPPDLLCGVGTMGSGVTANLTVVVRSRMWMGPRAFYPKFNAAIRFHFLQVCWGVLEGCEARKRAGSAAERPVL